MKKILVISQYYFPERFRVNDICESWVKEGKDVTVITGIPNYPMGKFFSGYGFTKKRSEVVNGVKVIRIPIIPRGKSSIMLGLNYFSFVISGFFWKLFHGEKYDSIFIYELSPMMQALPGIWYGKKNIPVSIYVMDLWPENFEIVTGIHNKFVIRKLDKMVNYIYRNCKYIFTASQSFKTNIESRGFSKDKVIFWPQYAEEFYQPSLNKSTKIQQSQKLNITFAGNIGVAQGLDLLPKVAAKLKSGGQQVMFNVVGDGRFKAELVQQTNKLQVADYFTFIDAVPPEEIPELLAASDFSLVSLASNEIFKMTIPAKIQSSMACGIPILVSGDGEVQEVIEAADCGLTAKAGSVEELCDIITKASSMEHSEIIRLGKNARQFFENNYEKEYLLNKIDKYL